MTNALKTTYKGEEILHRLLWHIVEDEAEHSAENEREWFNPALVSMVFAFHTVEAYLNYVGERIAPHIWKDERNYFRKKTYRGWEGKLRKVMELVDIPWIDSDRPLKTILELRDLRDMISHGKPEKLTGEVSHPQGTEAPLMTSTIRQKVLKHDLKATLSDVEQFLLQIHTSAKSLLANEDVWFGDHPLRGTSQYVACTTNLVEQG